MIIVPYIHELSDWPRLRWRDDALQAQLGAVRHRQGRLIGRMEALGIDLQREATLRVLTEDVIRSSEIEGLVLDASQTRSSIARRLGMDVAGLTPSDQNIDGIVDVLVDATQFYDRKLTKRRLLAWHAALFPTGHSGIEKIIVGGWRSDRSGPMQVVSGTRRQNIHFQAPSAQSLDGEVQTFLRWFAARQDIDPVLKAGVAHFWFVTIHPFQDGNGRIARAIADMALARSEQSARRFYSMSAQIRADAKSYYNILETTQSGGLDITAWLQWFLDCLDHAFDRAEDILSAVISKAAFWERHASAVLNERQRLVLNRLLDAFQGKLTSSKWAALTHSSQDTALRDLDSLVSQGILVKEPAGGRSTNYVLARHPRAD